MTRREQTRGRVVRIWISLIVMMGWTLGCGFISDVQSDLFGEDDSEQVAPAEELLRQGDLPGAEALYRELVAASPGSVQAHVGFAYTQVLAGDLGGADATLMAAEALAVGDEIQIGEIKLRRALVALRSRDLDVVKQLGAASGLPEGLLLAAEVHLIDLESDQAMAILTEIAEAPGAVGQTASEYLRMHQSGDQIQAGLAEATALWALGERESACEAAEDLVKALPADADAEDKDEQLLLWAGRAVTSGLPGVARSLIDEMAFPPDGQQWRLSATKAMVALSEGETDQAMAIFDALKSGAESGDVPRQGLDDALSTACVLTDRIDVAKKLVEGVESAGATKCLVDAGAVDEAQRHAPEGTLKAFLENM